MRGQKMKKITITIILVIIIAVITGISIYNTPTNRIGRHLDLGQKYLGEQNYEQAVVEFDRAIAIDEKCIQAHLGSIEAHLSMGSGAEELLALYDKALSIIEGLDKAELQKNIEYVVEIYLLAEQIYIDDIEHTIEILKRGYEKTKDIRIHQLLEVIENKMENAGKDETDGDLSWTSGEISYPILVLGDDIKDKFDDIINACLENSYTKAIDILWSEEFYDVTKNCILQNSSTPIQSYVDESDNLRNLIIKTVFENYHIYIKYDTVKASDKSGIINFVFLPQSGIGGMLTSRWNGGSTEGDFFSSYGCMICPVENYVFNGDYTCYREKLRSGNLGEELVKQSEKGKFKDNFYDGTITCDEETHLLDVQGTPFHHKITQRVFENGQQIIWKATDGRYYSELIYDIEADEWNPNSFLNENSDLSFYEQKVGMYYADDHNVSFSNVPPWN